MPLRAGLCRGGSGLGRAAGRRRPLPNGWELERERVPGSHGDDLAVVGELERWAVEYLVRGSICGHRDLEQAAAEGDAEGEALERGW